MATLTPSPEAAAAEDSSSWSFHRRAIVSLVLAIHLLAVVIGPLTFASSRPPGIESPVLGPIMQVMQPYVDLAYLNHGYFFFAPNPGANHLVRYRVDGRSGQPAVEQTMPDRQRHWPRLLYHRHFMLTETLNRAFIPEEPPAEIHGDWEALRRWQFNRQTYEALRRGFQRHLAQRFGGEQVELVRVEHRPPDPMEVMERRIDMRDPSLYRDLPESEPGSQP